MLPTSAIDKALADLAAHKKAITGGLGDEIQKAVDGVAAARRYSSEIDKAIGALSTGDEFRKAYTTLGKFEDLSSLKHDAMIAELAKHNNANAEAFDKLRAVGLLSDIADPRGRAGYGAPPGQAGARASQAAAVREQAATPVSSVADLGIAIRHARKALGLNQQAFADLAGVGRRFVSELESGKASLEFGRILQCCAAAGIDLLAARRRVA